MALTASQGIPRRNPAAGSRPPLEPVTFTVARDSSFGARVTLRRAPRT